MQHTLMTHPGDSRTIRAGNRQVHIHYTGPGAGLHVYRVEVTTTGPVAIPVGDDGRPFGHPDHAAAQATAEHYAAQLVELLTVEQQGIPDERIAAVAQGVNNILDADHTARVAAYERQQEAVAAIMVPAQRKVRDTRTHVFRQELTPAQHAAVRAHDNGTVRLGNGVTRPMLAAIADKAYGDLVMVPGTRYTIDHLVLNTRGLNAARQEAAA
jgi:hypothetical protein